MGLNIGQLKDKKAVERELAKIAADEQRTLKLIEEVEQQAYEQDSTWTGVLSEWCGNIYNYMSFKSKING